MNDLIKDVERIIDDNIREYNLLEAAGIGSREVYICRLLYSLINPHNKYGYKNVYLKVFLSDVLKLKDVSTDKDITVSIEQPTEDKRRIDFFISADKYLIPIETKIYTGDQDKQCL